jgi:hypothetical protein
MRSIESIERTLGRFHRQDMKVLEHEPARELVSPVDLLRTDELGRKYIACPAGQPPHSQLQLTDEEKAALVEPGPSLPQGHMTPIAFGFSPNGVVKGEYESNG